MGLRGFVWVIGRGQGRAGGPAKRTLEAGPCRNRRQHDEVAPAIAGAQLAVVTPVTRTRPAPAFGAVEGNQGQRHEHVRVSTAFNKTLGIAGAAVASVTFTPAGIVIGVRRRRSKLACPCGWKTWAIYDRSVRRWRHLDWPGRSCGWKPRCRGDCRRCARVRTEQVPWARTPHPRHAGRGRFGGSTAAGGSVGAR